MSDRSKALLKALNVIKPIDLAKTLQVSPQAISQWVRVPVTHVLKIEQLTGVPRHELRPDIYPPPQNQT